MLGETKRDAVESISWNQTGICNPRQNASVTTVTDPQARPADSHAVTVDLGPRSYEIRIGTGILEQTPALAEGWLAARFGDRLSMPTGRIPKPTGRIPWDSPTRRTCLVTDANVADSHAATVGKSFTNGGWHCETIVLQPGEDSKRLAVVSAIYDRLVDLKADRQTLLVAVGGGVVGDAAGFAAATYARGLPFLQVPTTLLAQVDSSVGGKVGINHPQGKNLIGAFHQPVGVVIDTKTLSTLPDRDYRSGLAEVVKYGVILDADFFAFLEAESAGVNGRRADVVEAVIARCCRLKAQVVEQDEQERSGLRAVLNYGHTFAHAFEALSGYGELLHGEAVAIGMVYAAELAKRLERVDDTFCRRQKNLLETLSLPTRLPAPSSFRPAEILDRMRLDKKAAGGELRFVLPSRMGHVELVTGVPEEMVSAVLSALQSE